jgi:hypothetical protein
MDADRREWTRLFSADQNCTKQVADRRASAQKGGGPEIDRLRALGVELEVGELLVGDQVIARFAIHEDTVTNDPAVLCGAVAGPEPLTSSQEGASL